MVYRYLKGQVYCTRCSYRSMDQTWKDKSGHARCGGCSNRVRMKPRSSRLKEIMRDVNEKREILIVNSQKTDVPGYSIPVIEYRL